MKVVESGQDDVQGTFFYIAESIVDETFPKLASPIIRFDINFIHCAPVLKTIGKTLRALEGHLVQNFGQQ